MAAIAAVGTALGHVLLAPEADAAVPALPREKVNAREIDQHAVVRERVMMHRLRFRA
jgi:hypothetical protein